MHPKIYIKWVHGQLGLIFYDHDDDDDDDDDDMQTIKTIYMYESSNQVGTSFQDSWNSKPCLPHLSI